MGAPMDQQRLFTSFFNCTRPRSFSPNTAELYYYIIQCHGSGECIIRTFSQKQRVGGENRLLLYANRSINTTTKLLSRRALLHVNKVMAIKKLLSKIVPSGGGFFLITLNYPRENGRKKLTVFGEYLI
jgi:hypothetical protein